MDKITVSNIDIDLVRKKIKNIHLSVYPPDGRVRLAVPEKMNDEAVRVFAVSKLAWIMKQRKKFSAQDRQTEREFISGESHYYFGERCLLNVIETNGKQHVELRGNKYIDLYVRPGSTVDKREKIMSDWYRQNIKAIIPDYINKWEDIIGVSVNDWGVKLMKTKWGTCNVQDKRIWINLELAKKNPRCIEYIVVHEMVHLLERHHNDTFKAYMTKFLSNWKSIKDELNGLTFDSSKWSY
ncbi:M48 family metallopeptidase [Sedimentibacter sp.]|uniref:M48 family metallopeptidase n=1 Tax=Sedimentibacter sp. TaxID=1960295 RepID=UPI003994F33E